MLSSLLRGLRRIISSLGLLVVGWSAPGAAIQAQPVTCADPGSTMLWQVGGEALRQRGVVVHLFGSIHVGKPDFYPLPAPVETVFRDADHLVFEIDPRNAADPATAMRMQLRGLLPSGQSLDQVVGPATMEELQRVLDRHGIPLVNFMNLKPWMITLLLANFQANSLGFDATWGLESYFTGQKADDTEVLELETIEQQVDMLDSLDPETFLGYSLREYDQSATQLEVLMQAWRCGDHAALEQVMFAAEADLPRNAMDDALADRLHAQLFTERNGVMADGIEGFITGGTGSYFVVVGAGHLLGEDSVIALLRQRGYTVEPVRL